MKFGTFYFSIYHCKPLGVTEGTFVDVSIKNKRFSDLKEYRKVLPCLFPSTYILTKQNENDYST